MIQIENTLPERKTAINLVPTQVQKVSAGPQGLLANSVVPFFHCFEYVGSDGEVYRDCRPSLVPQPLKSVVLTVPGVRKMRFDPSPGILRGYKAAVRVNTDLKAKTPVYYWVITMLKVDGSSQEILVDVQGRTAVNNL